MTRAGNTTARGYGHTHQQERARHAPTVDAGHAWCTEIRCLELEDGRTRWIPPGTPWQLAHNRDTGDYLGPAHRRCNEAEGARHGNALRNGHHTTDQPTRWTLGI